MGFILQEADVLNEALGVGEGSRCWLCGSKYIWVTEDSGELCVHVGGLGSILSGRQISV